MKRSNWLTNLVTGGMVLVFIMVLSCCTITTVSLRYYDKTKPVEEYSRVYFQGNWQILTFNNDNVANAFSLANTVVIPGGEHTFGLRYAQVSGSSSTTVTTYSDTITLKYDFKPDRFYYVYPTVQSNNVRVNVLDATNSTAAELRTAGFPTETTNKILERRADSEETLRKKTGK